MPRARKLEKDLFDPPPGAMVAGIDEAGRGPLAGPVFAAAVIIAPDRVPEGVADSKQLSEDAREELFPLILHAAVAVGIGQASVKEIDKINIHHATLLAMKRAFKELTVPCDFVYVDGVYLPRIKCQGRAVVDGDALIAQVSAASIIAKVSRDRLMRKLDEKIPRVRLGPKQGLFDPRPLRRAQSARPYEAPPHVVRACPPRARRVSAADRTGDARRRDTTRCV